MKYFKWSLFVIGLLVAIIVTPVVLNYILKLFLCWTDPITGPITAIVIVFYSYLGAPKYNVMLSVIGFLAGALTAYAVLEQWYPECHELAYQKTYIPLAVTHITGLIALAYCIYLSKTKHNK